MQTNTLYQPTKHPEFALDSSFIHLNHAGTGPWPRRTTQAVTTFAQENLILGSMHYPAWVKKETRLRQQLQRLINAPQATDIALMKNTSEALSTIAFGLNWQPGDNIVGIRQEFPSNRILWEALEQRFGVTFRQIDLKTTDDPETALSAATDHKTRLVAVSAVQYANGFKLDLEKIGEFCHKQGILFSVDAIQQLGAMPFDVQAIQADFVCADGHKWMLAPEGVALLYVKSDIREQLTLNQFGWHMVEAIGDFDAPDWQPAGDARRFEAGSPNNLGIHALSASLSLFEEVGIPQINEKIRDNIQHCIAHIDRRQYILLSPTASRRQSGIVTFAVPGHDSQSLYEQLMEHNVFCAPRGGGIRFSPHFYTPPESIDEAFRILDNLCHA